MLIRLPTNFCCALWSGRIVDRGLLVKENVAVKNILECDENDIVSEQVAGSGNHVRVLISET